MEYQRIANLIDDASNPPSKFRTKNWLEINDYSDAYILVTGKITITGEGDDAAAI